MTNCTHGGVAMNLAIGSRCPFGNHIVEAGGANPNAPEAVHQAGEAGPRRQPATPATIAPAPNLAVGHAGAPTAGGDGGVTVACPPAGHRPATVPGTIAEQDPTTATVPSSGRGLPQSVFDGNTGPATSAAPTLLDLIDATPAARATDPDTAVAAARKAQTTAAKNRLICLRAHAEAPNGLTGDELAEATGLPYETIGPRRPGLERAGLVEKAEHEDGRPMRRPNNDGNAVQVYRITEAGRAALAAEDARQAVAA